MAPVPSLPRKTTAPIMPRRVMGTRWKAPTTTTPQIMIMSELRLLLTARLTNTQRQDALFVHTLTWLMAPSAMGRGALRA